MNAKETITGGLILRPCLVAGDKLWTIALAVLVILAGLLIAAVVPVAAEALNKEEKS